MQVAVLKPLLTAPSLWFLFSQPEFRKLPSNLPFNFDLRRYNKGTYALIGAAAMLGGFTRMTAAVTVGLGKVFHPRHSLVRVVDYSVYDRVIM